MTVPERAILRHVPNALTIARLCAIPVFIYLFLSSDGYSLAAGLVFMAAAFTDFFDGMIARRAGVMSVFGKIADPLADRLLVSTAAVLLSFADHAERLPVWAFMVVVWRDVLTITGYFVVKKRLLPDVNRAGKFGTFGMMAGISWMLVLENAQWPVWLFWAGVVLSIVALCEYFVKYRWVLGENEGAKGAPGALYSAGQVEPDKDTQTTGDIDSGSTS